MNLVNLEAVSIRYPSSVVVYRPNSTLAYILPARIVRIHLVTAHELSNAIGRPAVKTPKCDEL